MSAVLRDRQDLRPLQVDFAEHIKNGAGSIGLVEVGLGKTAAVLTAFSDIAREDALEGKIRRALVIAPRRVARDTWRDEASKWSHLDNIKIDVALGSEAARIKALTNPIANVVTINYENVAWMFDNFPPGQLGFYFLVIDEADKFKCVDTERFRAIRHRIFEFEMRVAMTGTPTPESVTDIWAIAYLATAERSRVKVKTKDGIKQRVRITAPLGSSYNLFKEDFFQTNAYTKRSEPRPHAVDTISRAIKPYAYVARRKDHLDLPEILFIDKFFDLPPKVRRMYDSFEKEFALALEKGDGEGALSWDEDEEDTVEVAADNAAVLRNKLRQVCSGFVYSGDGPDRKTTWLHNEKLSMFKDFVSELHGEQLLAVYGYKAEHVRLRLVDRLGGGMSDRRERDILKRWNNKEVQVLGMHPASAGHGLNLHESGAHNIAYLTLPWSRGLFDQTNGRLDRRNQKRQVIVHRFIAKNTVEEDVIKGLESKGSVQKYVLDSIARRARA